MRPTVFDRIDAVAETLSSAPPPPADHTGLPPGPRWPSIVQSVGVLTFRHRFIPAMQRRYGSTFTLKLIPGDRAMVFFHEPEAIKQIFAGDPDVFHAGKGNAILGPLMGEHSLLLQDGAEHKRARRMLMPAFGATAITGYREMVHEIARGHIATWPTATPFASLDAMNEITLDVILKVVFGVTDEDHLEEFRPLVRSIIEMNPLVLITFRFPLAHRVLPALKKMVSSQALLDAAIYDQIARRRAAGDDGGRDVLSQLLRVQDEDGSTLSDTELRDQLVTLLMAGHETTATALAWTLHEIGSDPQVAANASAAAAAGDDAYLEALMKEAMRLHPVIAMVARMLVKPAVIGGVSLPAGAYVGGSILLAHADEMSHPGAATYRPERFLEGEVHPNTWIPFGGGVRRCIGAAFSMMEGVAVLNEIFAAHDLAVPTGAVETAVVRNITSVPKHGAMVTITRR